MKKSSYSKLVLPCNFTNVNEKAAYSKIYYLVTILTNIQITYIRNGHPNQSVHITISTTKY